MSYFKERIVSRQQVLKDSLKLTIRLPKELVNILNQQAKEQNTSVQTLIVEAVVERCDGVLNYSRVAGMEEAIALANSYGVPASIQQAIDEAKRNLAKRKVLKGISENKGYNSISEIEEAIELE